MSYWIHPHVWSNDLSPLLWNDVWPQFNPIAVIWNVCYQRLGKTNVKNENCALPFVWDWGEVSGLGVSKKKIKKIIMSTQREMHVFAQCMKAQREGRVTGRICQNLFLLYFISCLWTLGKTMTGKHWGKAQVWALNWLNWLFNKLP